MQGRERPKVVACAHPTRANRGANDPPRRRATKAAEPADEANIAAAQRGIRRMRRCCSVAKARVQSQTHTWRMRHVSQRVIHRFRKKGLRNRRKAAPQGNSSISRREFAIRWNRTDSAESKKWVSRFRRTGNSSVSVHRSCRSLRRRTDGSWHISITYAANKSSAS